MRNYSENLMSFIVKLKRFADEPLLEKAETISHFYWLLKSQLYYKHFFKKIGSGSRILKPLRLKNVQNVSIGSQVLIHKYCWLQTNSSLDHSEELIIGNGSILGNFNHITCAERVEIGENVLTADRVFITDHGHQYCDITRPIMHQQIAKKRPVSIGSGSWIGENAVIMSCCIGKNCVIGSNAVVVNDIPDFSVVTGAPGKVIRRFDTLEECWKRVSNEVNLCTLIA